MKRKLNFRKGFNIVLIINLIVILSVFIFNNLITELTFHYYDMTFGIILAVNIILFITLNKFKDKKYIEDIIIFLLLLYLIIAFWIPVCSEGESGVTKTNSGVTIPYGYSKSYNCYNICIDETHIK